MEFTKIKKYEDVKNLTEIADLFFFHELIPCEAVFCIIADYEHNTVFLKPTQYFYEQNLLAAWPELFIKLIKAGTEDITLDVFIEFFRNLRKAQGDQMLGSFALKQQLEASIYTCFRNGQVNYLKK